MNRIVKAFIISLALSGILLVFFRFQEEEGQEKESPLIPLLKKGPSSYSVKGTLVISADHQHAYATADILKKRMAAITPRFTLEAKNDSLWTLNAENISQPRMLNEFLTDRGGVQWYEMCTLANVYPYLKLADSLLHQQLIASQKRAAANPPPEGDTDIQSLLSKKRHEDGTKTESENPVFSLLKLPDPESIRVSGVPPYFGTVAPYDTALLTSYLENTLVTSRLPADFRFIYGPIEPLSKSDPPLGLYAIRKEKSGPLLDESCLSEVRLQNDSSSGGEEIFFQFNQEGIARWERIRSWNVCKQVAMLSNGMAFASIKVDDSIGRKNCVLHFHGSDHEHILLFSTVLKYGPLPAPVTIRHLSASPSGFFKYPWVKYLLLGGISFVVFFALALFIDRVLQNAARLSRNTGANG